MKFYTNLNNYENLTKCFESSKYFERPDIKIHDKTH